MNKSDTAMKWMVLILFGGLGIAALTGGLSWGVKRLQLMQSGVTTTATVVDLEKSVSKDSDGHSSVSYYPIVKFIADDGKEYQAKGSTGGSHSEYSIGQQVEIIYSPENPYEAQLTDFVQFWLGPVVLTIAGIVMATLGIGSFFIVGGAMRANLRENDLASTLLKRQGIKISATIREIESVKKWFKTQGYVLICESTETADANKVFRSTPLVVYPKNFIGKPVDIYLDPYDGKKYFIDLEPLFAQLNR